MQWHGIFVTLYYWHCLIVLEVLIAFIVFFQGHLDVHGPGVRTAKQLWECVQSGSDLVPGQSGTPWLHREESAGHPFGHDRQRAPRRSHRSNGREECLPGMATTAMFFSSEHVPHFFLPGRPLGSHLDESVNIHSLLRLDQWLAKQQPLFFHRRLSSLYSL